MKFIYKYYNYLNQKLEQFDRLTLSTMLLIIAAIITAINLFLIFSGIK